MLDMSLHGLREGQDVIVTDKHGAVEEVQENIIQQS